MYINDEKSVVECTVLSAESKPYDFNGNSGVSHSIRLSVSGEIIVCKSTKEQVDEYKGFVGKTGTASIEILSRKEVCSFKVSGFTV